MTLPLEISDLLDVLSKAAPAPAGPKLEFVGEVPIPDVVKSKIRRAKDTLLKTLDKASMQTSPEAKQQSTAEVGALLDGLLTSSTVGLSAVKKQSRRHRLRWGLVTTAMLFIITGLSVGEATIVGFGAGRDLPQAVKWTGVALPVLGVALTVVVNAVKHWIHQINKHKSQDFAYLVSAYNLVIALRTHYVRQQRYTIYYLNTLKGIALSGLAAHADILIRGELKVPTSHIDGGDDPGARSHPMVGWFDTMRSVFNYIFL